MMVAEEVVDRVEQSSLRPVTLQLDPMHFFKPREEMEVKQGTTVRIFAHVLYYSST